jgi:hypothetical protein
VAAAITTTDTTAVTAAVTDRLTVILLSLATFFVLLGFLAKEVEPSGTLAARPVTVVRKIYETKVITTIPANAKAPAGGTSVTQSTSGSLAPMSAAPTTRTS